MKKIPRTLSYPDRLHRRLRQAVVAHEERAEALLPFNRRPTRLHPVRPHSIFANVNVG